MRSVARDCHVGGSARAICQTLARALACTSSRLGISVAALHSRLSASQLGLRNGGVWPGRRLGRFCFKSQGLSETPINVWLGLLLKQSRLQCSVERSIERRHKYKEPETEPSRVGHEEGVTGRTT
eukprot:1630203-Rhodomonas_salina.1